MAWKSRNSSAKNCGAKIQHAESHVGEAEICAFLIHVDSVLVHCWFDPQVDKESQQLKLLVGNESGRHREAVGDVDRCQASDEIEDSLLSVGPLGQSRMFQLHGLDAGEMSRMKFGRSLV